MTGRKDYFKNNFQNKSRKLHEAFSEDYRVVNNHVPLLKDWEPVRQLCEKYQVEKLYLFGSAARGDLRAVSDLDFLVKFKDFELQDYLENFLGLKENLENVLKRRIDLIEHQTLKNPVLIRSINKSKILVYGGKD